MTENNTLSPGTWDFSGECDPAVRNNGSLRFTTFTLGLFQWQAKSRGKALKKGKVGTRVKGMSDNPEPARELARNLCAKLNSGELKPESLKKTYTVWGKFDVGD